MHRATLLKAIGMSNGEANGRVRISWCDLNARCRLGSVAKTINGLL
jgi:cysteine sulfinate desulfinase/cysteine desulfurase-like protein